jgi:hypothetical protein
MSLLKVLLGPPNVASNDHEDESTFTCGALNYRGSMVISFRFHSGTQLGTAMDFTSPDLEHARDSVLISPSRMPWLWS